MKWSDSCYQFIWPSSCSNNTTELELCFGGERSCLRMRNGQCVGWQIKGGVRLVETLEWDKGIFALTGNISTNIFTKWDSQHKYMVRDCQLCNTDSAKVCAEEVELLTIGVFMPAIFCLNFEFIFVLILGFRVTSPSYISFLIGLKITYKLVPKSTLWDKN